MDRRRFLRTLGLGAAGLALSAPVRDRAVLAAGLEGGRQAVVTADQLNVRGGPSAGDPRVGSLDRGAAVDLLGAAPDGVWWRIATDALVGYVDGSYLEPSDAPAASTVFDLDLVLPYSSQLTAVWCDPADIEMWLGYHVPTPDIPSRARQQAMWSWELAHNAGFTEAQWNCSPFAVAGAAHEWMPTFGFDHFRFDEAMSASRLLAWQLAANREPSVALIWKGAHYVLVRGVRALGNPAEDPSGVRLLGFYIADPNRADRSWMGQDRFIPLDRWLGELLTPVSYLTAHTGIPGDVWQNRYVTIQRDWTTEGPSANGQ